MTFRIIIRFFLIAPLSILGACSSEGRAQISASRSQESQTETARLVAMQQRLFKLNNSIVNFWLKNGVDGLHGGIYGEIDGQGIAKPASDKGVIQETRHLWTLSSYYEHTDPAIAFEVKKAAMSVKNFIVEHLRDNADGLFYLKVSADGSQIKDRGKQYYANAYAIYSLAQYGKSFADEGAADLALKAFRALVNRPYDASRGGYDPAYGGFDQSSDPWYFVDKESKKSMSAHMHLLEAFTALYNVTHDAHVKEVLNSLLTVFVKNMMADRTYIHSEYRRDFTLSGPAEVKYGYNLIGIWLTYEAAKACGRENELEILAAIKRVGAFSAQKGFDEELGGYFEMGTTDGAVVKKNKVWWIQAEAMMGLWRLYELTGEDDYLDKLEGTLNWIERYQVDPLTGEWYREVIGTKPGTANTTIGDEWKDSYHHGRATMLLGHWIEKWLTR